MTTPARAIAPPAICRGLIGSAKIRKPNPAAITGWIRMITEAVAAGSRPSAQLIEPWPATCTTPRPMQASQPESEVGKRRSPSRTAATSNSGAPISEDQNITGAAPWLNRALRTHSM